MINPDDFVIIDIENRNENFTDIELNEILHDHTKTTTNNDEFARQLIDFCKYISYVKDETLLNSAIEYVKKNVPINLKNFDTDFKQITVTGNFSDNDLIKIKAIYFSLIVRYEIMVIKENPPQMEPPIFDFYIDVDNKLVYYNLPFVINQIRNNFDVGFVEFTHKKPLNEAMPYYIDYITELQNSHHRRLEVNTERILFITNAKNNYLEKQQYLNNKSQEKENPFSVLEWATIFYYADSCKYFNQKNKTENQSFFIDKHSITTSKKSFKNKVIEVSKAINNIQNYSIEKLNKILPFVKENYNKGVAKLENDKEFLKINNKNDTDY